MTQELEAFYLQQKRYSFEFLVKGLLLQNG